MVFGAACNVNGMCNLHFSAMWWQQLWCEQRLSSALWCVKCTIAVQCGLS